MRIVAAPAPRAPPDMEDLVLELEAAYSDSSLSAIFGPVVA